MLGRRASRLAPPLPTRITRAHYPGGAMGTSRPTAITPAIFAPPLPPRITPPVRPAPYPVVRSRCGRARCPHRAAAPSARCAAWHRAIFARAWWHSALHTRITRAARWGHRALPPLHTAHYPGDAWPPGLPARALPPLHTAHYPGGAMVARRGSRLAPPCRPRIARGGSPPRAARCSLAHCPWGLPTPWRRRHRAIPLRQFRFSPKIHAQPVCPSEIEEQNQDGNETTPGAQQDRPL